MSVKPLVPEVSLLFDQDKSRSFYITSSPEVNKQESNSEYKLENGHSIYPNNQLESYNSWKAKNATVLYTLTGSLNKSDTKKQRAESKMSSDLRNKHTYPNEVFSGADAITSSPVHRHHVPKTIYTDQIRAGVSNCQSQESAGFTHRQIGIQRHNTLENNPLYRPYPQNDNNLQYRECEINPQMTNFQNAHHNHESNTRPTLPLVTHDPYNSQQAYPVPNSHASHEPASKLQQRDFHEPTVCQTNPGYCECRHKNNMAGFKNQIESDNTRAEGREHYLGLQCKDSKVESSLDIAKINNQTVMDLYKIINLQNEQILMLQQQVKQVLQIHLDCDRKVVSEKPLCHSCPCEQRPNKNCKNDSNKHDCNCNEQENFVQHKASCSTAVSIKPPKRSVGIMTTPFKDKFDGNSGTDSNDSNDRRKSNELTKGKNPRQKQKRIKPSSTSCKNSKKRSEHEERKGKAQYVSPHEK